MVSLLPSKNASHPMDAATRRNRLRRAILESLERRELMAADIHGVFAPNTTAEYRDAWNAQNVSLNGINPIAPTGGNGISNFNATSARWTNPTGGSTPVTGDPARITWSIVPDGTLNNNDNLNSNLISFMDSIYGGGTGPVANRPWFGLVKSVFDRWSQDTGLTYVYEAADDGSTYGGSGNRGVVGVRGDVRIGGNRIDGDFGTLAYNFLPTGGGNAGFDGDMVIDTADRFFRDSSNGPTGENRGLVNTLAHEAGHGLGLGHTLPINSTKLMEPNVSLAFLGIQHDDLLGAQTLYGDDKEKNNTAATATDLGTLGNGTISIGTVSVNGTTGDNDWYKFQIAAAGKVTVNLAPVGQQYTVGSEGGAAPAPVDTQRYVDLRLELVAADGTVLASVNNGALGANETITALQLPSGGQYFVRAFGAGANPQLYNLSITLSGIVTQSAQSTGPRLLSVAPNSGEIFNINRVNTLSAVPTELVLRFAGGSDLDATTLAKGVRVTRAGRDGLFNGTNDKVIVPGYIGFGDNTSIVVLRFAETLPDDLYRVEVMGQDVPAENLAAIKDTSGQKLTPRVAGTDRDIYNFRLQLGAQVVAVVPQPTDRATDGTLAPQLDTIRVYFNDDDLDPTVAINPNFYQLIFTSDSVQPNDDVRFVPTTVTYDNVADMATLKFSSRIDQLAGAGTYRLRVGSNTVVNSVANLPSVPLVVPGTDPSGYFGSAVALDAQLVNGSVKVNESLNNTGNPLPLDFMGSDLDPGNRDINPTQQGKADNHVGDSGDGSAGIATATYTFSLTTPYGNDVSGRPVFTTITPDQMQRVREIFEFYSEQLGVDFAEVDSDSATFKVVVGDMWPNGVASRPGGEAGIAGGGLAIMDGAETWDNSFGGGFFGVALHEIGHLLGLGHTYDLPDGTTMGSTTTATTQGTAGVATQQFPGYNDVIHGQFLYRPDNKDVDLYKFTVGAGQTKTLHAETIAERLANSSNADTVITLYKQTATGLTVLASNNDYFSSDSFLSLDVEGGATGTTYFIAVTVAGNQDFDPSVTNTGSGGVSAGSYQLVVDLVDKANPSLVDTDGIALDGDGDGQAGGDFNFWFRTAAPAGVALPGAPKTVYVDKGYTGGGSNGSPAAPYTSLPTALGALVSGDILRVVGSIGTDSNLATSSDNPAYELGRGGPGNAVLADGLSFQVPQGVTMMIDAGAIFKVRGSRVIAGSQGTGSDASFSAIQVLGTPTQPVFFTSYDDQSLGVDTNPIITTPQAGDWAGIEIHNDVDRAQGRGDYERRGIFLNYIAGADIRYGGGQVTVATPSPAISPIYMAEARPTLLYNKISRSADAAMSADPDSFEETRFTEPRYQLPRFVGDTGYQPDYDRVGPEIRGNTLTTNSVNGIFIRVPTAPGQEITSLNVSARFDDTDIVHVLGENLTIGGTPGGAWSQSVKPNVSLLQGTAGTGGTLTVGVNQYKISFVDRFGGEGLPSAAVSLTVPSGSSSLTINNLPPATGEFVGRRIWRLAPGDTTYKLVAEIDRSSTAFVDKGALAGVDGGLLNQSSSQRARPDARLAIDPGIIVKSIGSRIEVGMSAQLIAEGTASRPVVFTSKLDDRYGAGGTFDTNNDGATTVQNAGDWGGLNARHLSNMSIDHALIAFGGGTTSVPGGFAGFNAVEFHQAEGRVANSVIENNASGVSGNLAGNRGGRGVNASAAIFVDASQPVIIDNIIRNNLATAVNIDADSLKAVPLQDTGRQTGSIDRLPGALGNYGPLVRGNRLAGNFTNGMEVRGGVLTTEVVWDDTDIVHVLRSDIAVPNFHHVGGVRLVSHVDESLVVKLEGASAGFTASGEKLDINDRIGGTVQIEGAPGFPVVLTSLKDDTVGAGFDPTGLPQFDTNGNSSGNAPAPGDWRSIRLEAVSNDRNVATMPELETDQIQDRGTNDDPVTAQSLGGLATSVNYGDENLRLGFTISGAIASPQDVDIYSFVGKAGTQVWFDIDRTGASLDSVIELITESGAILAQSDDSLAESAAVAVNLPSTLFQSSNTSLIAPNQAQVMDRDPLAVKNSWNTSIARDLGSINPRDAGMRVVLPGTANTDNTYYIRVRSSNLNVGDPHSKLQDGNFVRDGKTTGAYRMQVRLQQTDEVGGSAIHYADIRYATNGLEALATPMHSQLLGDNAVTSTPGTIGTGVINLGDLGASDRGALSIAGQLSSASDVAFYEFSVKRNDVQIIQPPSGTLPFASTHVSTVFDIDYADGVGGPNTNLWVFSKSDLRLVYMGSDSNIQDDRAAPTQGSDQDDMSRGSAGSKDAFIGAQALPVGDYIVAVTNNSQTSAALAQYQYRNASQGSVNASLTRMEPIESVQRIAEDRFEDSGPLNPSTANGPIQVAFESTQAGITAENQVPFTLGDLVSYVITDNTTTSTHLGNVNLMTGALEEDISNSSNARLRDVTMSPDGRLVGYHVPDTASGLVTDGNSGGFVQLNWQGAGGAQTALGNSGIQTFTTESTGATTAAIRQRTQNNAQVGDGIQFNGLTIWSNNSLTNASQVMIGVGSRGNGINSFSRAILDANNNPVAVGAQIYNTTNVVYALDPNSGAFVNAGGANSRTGNGIVNNSPTSNPGTAAVEMGRFLSGTLAGRYQEGTVTGLAKIGNVLYAVSNLGELFRATVGGGTSRFSADPLDFTLNNITGLGTGAETGEAWGGRLPFTTLRDPVTNQLINFQGLAAGPTNLKDADGNSLANTLFAISSTGVIYAFDVNGNPVNVFPDGTNRTLSTAAPVGSPQGFAFSPLDVNLWHVTRTRAGEAGHGYPVTYDRSRSVPELAAFDRQSLYFGFENAGTNNLQQNGTWSNLHSVFNNSVNLPGGAKGAVESQPIDLTGYSADDLPMLYFNYYLSTENRNAGNSADNNFMRDSFRVYATTDGEAWTLLATNNAFNRSRTAPQSFIDGEDEYDQGVSNYIDAYGNPIVVQELYDVNDPGVAGQDNGGTAIDSWRQARLNLAPFAGNNNLRLRFEFATGGTFNSGQPLVGGVELTAVAAYDLTDGQTVTLSSVDLTNNVSRRFEFDFGLVLNLPGGASIPAGSTLTTPFGVFNLSTTPGPFNLVYAVTDTPAQVATKFQQQLQALGIVGYINAVRPNVLILPTSNVVTPGTYSFTGLSGADVIQGRPGVSAGNVSVPVRADVANYDTSAIAVRDALRTAFANTFSGGRTVSWSTYGQTLRFFKYNAVTTSPIGITTSRYGDSFGTNNNNAGLGVGVAERAQNNTAPGVFVDDIIIGFAERGEQVINAPSGRVSPGGVAFIPNPDYQPRGFDQKENEQGRFQLEIRTGQDYGISYPFDTPQIPPPADYSLLVSYDTNYRAAPSVGLQVPAAAQIADGTTFSLSGGATALVTFEFNVLNGPNDVLAAPTTPGNIVITLRTNMNANEVALAVRNAINSQTLIPVTGSVLGEMVSGGFDVALSNSSVVMLNGPASIGRTGLGLPPGSPLSLFTMGNDNAAFEDMGDQNRGREDQGQIIVSSTSFSFNSQWGVRLDDSSNPTSPRNLPTPNPSRLTVGTVLANNIFNSNVAGGITIIGDVSNGAQPIVDAPVGRIINNSFYGTRNNDNGVRATNGATPTILNNIFANFATAISVDAASSSTVVGANAFQNNANTGILGSFPISLTTADPLYVNPSAGNFYLRPLSQAIDSSLEALAERLTLSQIRNAIGLPPSPMLAPDRDIFGQRRVDDPSVSTPAGLGANVFKDRGATDRSDFAALQAVLLQPQDNDSANVDVDRTISYVRLTGGTLDYFSILLSDGEGIGPDPNTVKDNAVLLTENGRLLKPGIDYVFGYNINSRTIRLTPLSGIWRSDSVYEITLNNQGNKSLQLASGNTIQAGDTLVVTLADATTRTLTFRKTPTAAPLDVLISNTDSAYEVSLKVAAKLNDLLSIGGIKAYVQGSGLLIVSGAQSITSSRATTATIVDLKAIADLAGNALAANRANTLTQFTIVMPDVQVDYGDGIAVPTLQAVNGARHALLPADAPLLALGQFADGDSEGVPSASATSDDNESFVDLQTLGSSGGVVQGPSGPATLIMPAGNVVGLDGQKVTIIDPLLKTITLEFDNDATITPGSIAVNVLVGDTAAQVATKFAAAVNTALLAGSVAGVAAVTNGAVVSLGGSAGHKFILAAAAVARLPVGNVEMAMPATVGPALDGLTFAVTDGSGNVVRFEINNTALPPTLLANTVPVDVNLSSATPALLASAIADAINGQRSAGKLVLGVATVIGSSVTVRGNDEDGITFGNLFNSKGAPVPVTISSTGSGVVDAWIDWNGDGDYIDAGEQVIKGLTVQAGANVVPIQTPTGARIGFTTSRFRLSVMGNLLPDQLAVGGEVEDHLIEVVGGTPPVANNDAYTVAEDTVLTVAAPGVLSNDTDADASPLTVFDPDPSTAAVDPVVAPANGQLVLNTNGSFTYTPNLDFFGSDTFVYFVTDPRLLSNVPATVTITVTPVNDAPLAFDDTITILEDTVTTLPGSTFWANDQRHFRNNPNENGQTLTVVSAVIISPAGGSVSVVNDTLTYTPLAHYNNAINGPAKVLLTIRDGGTAGALGNELTSTSTLTINITPVNDRPEFTMPATHGTTEDAGPVTQAGFVTGIRPGPPAATDEATGPALQTENQQVSFQVRALIPALFKTQPAIDAAGQLTYELNPDVNQILENLPGGIPGFQQILVEVIAVDTGSAAATNLNRSLPVTFTILPTEINDAPEFTLPASTTSREDVGLVTLAGFVTGIRRGPVTALDETNQTLTAQFTYDTNAFSQAPTLNVTTGTLTYQTAAHVNSFTGQNLVVTVTITDSGRNDAPNVNSTVKSFTVNVTPVNDAPEFTMPATTGTSEDAGDVTVNNFITAIRPGPVAAIDEGSARENQTVSFNVRAINPSLFATLPTIDAAGTLQYRLADNVNSSLPFPAILVEVIGKDTGLAGPGVPPDVNTSAPVTFTIVPTPINDAPEFTIPATLTRLEDAGVVSVPGFMTAIRPGPASALDEASQTLSVSVVGAGSSFTQAPAIDLATGTLTFQTAPDVNNATGNNLVIVVTVTDSGSGVTPDVNSTTKTFTLSITPVNDVPRFTLPSSSTSVFEDNELVVGTAQTTINNFATGIAAGPATAIDETTLVATRQTLNFVTVSVSNPSLFEAAGQPRLSPTGVLSFDTATDQNGSSVVVVRLVDSGAGTSPDVNTSADQTFTIVVRPVNDAPEFTLPATVTGIEDAGLRTIPAFATNLRPGPITALDEAGQTFTVTVTALDPAAFSRQPTIAADGTLIYRTADNVNSSSPGRDLRVTVTLTDNGTAGPAPDTNVSITQTFTVVTTPVNDAPLFTLPTQEITVIEDQEQFSGTTLTLFPGFATGIAPGPASATDEATQSLSFNIIDVSSPELFSIAPTISPTGELSFKTASNRNGKSVVIVRLVDGGAFDAPNDNDSDRQTFTISVSPINDAPLFDIPAGLTVDEDQGLISRSGFATNVRRGPVGTDDENGQTIAFTVVAANPAAFEVQPTIEVDGTLSFKTAPNVNSSNADLTVRVLLKDSGLNSPIPNSNTSIEKTFSITVNAVNDPPIPNLFALNSTEDLQITIQSSAILLGDVPGPTADEAGQTLSITQVERVSIKGGVITPVFTSGVITSMTYTPAPNAVGVDTFLYVVSDDGSPSRSGTGTITIVLGELNDPPSFVKGADQTVLEDVGVVTINNWATNILAGSPSSIDEQATQVVTFTVTPDNPALFEIQPTVSSTGTLSFKPAKDAVGSTGLSIVATDSGSNVAPNVNHSAVSSFSITLTPTNDAPVFTAGAAVSVNEDSGNYSQPWASGIFPAAGLAAAPATATDEASQVVDFVITVDKPALFSVQPTITSAGVLSFTPAQNAVGVALISVVARDRGPAGPNDQNSSVAQVLTITINAVNDAPIATPDNLVGNENNVLIVPAPGLLVNDTDADGTADVIKAVAGTITSEQGAIVTISDDGSISYDPRSVAALQQLTTGQSVTDRFVYQIRDLAGALSSQATVSVVVNGIDDAPTALNDLFTVPVGQSQLLDVLANDSDVDSQVDPRTIVITSLPAFGTVVVNATGVVSYAAGVGFRGIDSFAYTVKDLAGNVSNEATVSVVVNNVPKASNDTANTVRNTPVTIDVLANDFDLDGSLSTGTVEIVEQPNPSGTVAVQSNGKIVFTPSNNYFGTATFSYFVKDNTGSPSNVATVQVTVGSAWKNPTLDLDVNADGVISPIDALLIINYINTGAPVDLPSSGVVSPPYFDPSGDEKVTAIDALLIINYLNTHRGSGEGEGESSQAIAAIEQSAAPMIVTMVTEEQMVAIAAPIIIREMESMLVDDQAACDPWSPVEIVSDTLVASSNDTDASVPLDELLATHRPNHSSTDRDDFFGTF